jgi:hypothetical protein
MYKNGSMKPVETVLRKGVGGVKEKDKELTLTEIYCKNFCKYHNYPHFNYNMLIIFLKLILTRQLFNKDIYITID